MGPPWGFYLLHDGSFQEGAPIQASLRFTATITPIAWAAASNAQIVGMPMLVPCTPRLIPAPGYSVAMPRSPCLQPFHRSAQAHFVTARHSNPRRQHWQHWHPRLRHQGSRLHSRSSATVSSAVTPSTPHCPNQRQQPSSPWVEARRLHAAFQARVLLLKPLQALCDLVQAELLSPIDHIFQLASALRVVALRKGRGRQNLGPPLSVAPTVALQLPPPSSKSMEKCNGRQAYAHTPACYKT